MTNGPAMTGEPILVAADLTKGFPGRRSAADVARMRSAPRLTALDQVSIELRPGQILGVVGESGSGKTTLARCLVRLVEPDSGSVRFDGRDVLAARGRELVEIRRSMQLVYQDPYSSLDPRIRIRETISEPARAHGLVDRAGVDELVARMLDLVGLPATIAARLPRDLSGGQRQRVAIARALALRPRVLIADEAVSALDVSIQAQILNLLDGLRVELDLAILFIAHQLGVIAHLADTVAVMYLGRIVESGPVTDLFLAPRHPYTAALLAANPGLRPRAGRAPSLVGEIPSPYAIPPGCRFSSRCRYVEDRCLTTEPTLADVGPDHVVRCHVLPPLAGVLTRDVPEAVIPAGSASPSGPATAGIINPPAQSSQPCQGG
jgi:oligopeptide/dipeptide ABC transporter ATP-binding protein